MARKPTQLIHPTPFRRRGSSLSSSEGAQLPLRPLHLVGRETEFCGQRLAGDFRRRMRENGRNSVRRPRIASLTDRNCEGFSPPGNRVGLIGLPGGAEGIQTAGHRDLTPSGRGIRQNLSGGRFGHPWQPKFPDRVHPFVNACRASPASKLRPTGNQTWPFWRANPCLAKRFKITPLPGLEPIDRRLVDGYVEARMAVGRQRDERRLRRGQHGEVRARGDETWWNVPPRAGSRASGVA